MYLLLATILVVLEAVFEGLKYEGHHKSSGFFEFILLCLTSFMSFAWITEAILPPQAWVLDNPLNFWKILVAYILYRFGCFDPIINIVRGKALSYLGETKNIDIGIRWFLEKTKISEGFFLFIRLLCLIIGGLILLNGNTDKILW